jgi:hypothetical protein
MPRLGSLTVNRPPTFDTTRPHDAQTCLVARFDVSWGSDFEGFRWGVILQQMAGPGPAAADTVYTGWSAIHGWHYVRHSSAATDLSDWAGDMRIGLTAPRRTGDASFGVIRLDPPTASLDAASGMFRSFAVGCYTGIFDDRSYGGSLRLDDGTHVAIQHTFSAATSPLPARHQITLAIPGSELLRVMRMNTLLTEMPATTRWVGTAVVFPTPSRGFGSKRSNAVDHDLR